MATDGRADERRGSAKQKDRSRLESGSSVASVWFVVPQITRKDGR